MTIKLLFFSLLRDAAGGTEETPYTIEDTDSIPVSGLLERLYNEYPDLRPWDGKILVAADLEYVKRDFIIRDGQEVAIMPPVQGG